MAKRQRAGSHALATAPGCISHERKSCSGVGGEPLTLKVLAHTRSSLLPTNESGGSAAKWLRTPRLRPVSIAATRSCRRWPAVSGPFSPAEQIGGLC